MLKTDAILTRLPKKEKMELVREAEKRGLSLSGLIRERLKSNHAETADKMIEFMLKQEKFDEMITSEIGDLHQSIKAILMLFQKFLERYEKTEKRIDEINSRLSKLEQSI